MDETTGKKKLIWFPPSAAKVYGFLPFNVINSHAIPRKLPWETHSSSLPAGVSYINPREEVMARARLEQHCYSEPKPEPKLRVRGAGTCPGKLTTSTAHSPPVQRSPCTLSKIPFPKHPLLLQPMLILQVQKKPRETGNECEVKVEHCSVILHWSAIGGTQPHTDTTALRLPGRHSHRGHIVHFVHH